MNDPIRILIADDHPVVRQGLAALLLPRNGMEVIGQAVNGREAVEMALSLQPDVILMDVVMPELGGIEAAAEIRRANPDARILFLTSFGDRQRLAKAIRVGALGYVLKDSPPDDLLHAIEGAYRGQLTLSPKMAGKLVAAPERTPTSVEPLTDRETEVLAAVAEGLSNRMIGLQLSISVNTVRTHISSMLGKLGLDNRTQLAVYAKDHGDRAAESGGR